MKQDKKTQEVDGHSETPAEQTQSSTNGKETAETVFDYEAMSGRLMGDEELIKTVAEAFMEDMQSQVEELEEAMGAGNAPECGALGHKIKGAAANVGGVALSSQALIVEQAGKANDIEAVQQALPELLERYKTLKNAIEERLL